MSRLVFLDIDGVLNSTKTAVGLGQYPHDFNPDSLKMFDWAAVGLLKNGAKYHSLTFVLSSSWRMYESVEVAASALGLPIIGATPIMPGVAKCRGDEIKTYLATAGWNEGYAILDDNSDMLPEQMPRFVQTDPNEGFGWADYVKLLALFGDEP